VPAGGIGIRSFYFLDGGFSVVRGFPASEMRPPVIQSGESVTFTNEDALPTMPQTEQAWHSITSCRAPCNRGSGIGYPLANGPIKFDSGQLGYGSFTSAEVTTGSNVYTTPPLTTNRKSPDRGETYTYFCRIHPFMRGSVRVKD
jgi:plastocyanin